MTYQVDYFHKYRQCVSQSQHKDSHVWELRMFNGAGHTISCNDV